MWMMRCFATTLLLACLVFEAEAQGTIRGTVRDDDGQPVAGARVGGAGSI
jgi:hypothetical protein